MNTVVVIPCRYASSRFNGKPLAEINGKPMIQMVYERSKRAAHVSEVYVATDDARIYNVVAGFGGKVVMTGTDLRTGTDRVADTAEKLNLKEDDVIVNVQGDQPLINPESLEDVLNPFIDDPAVYMCTLAFKIVDPRELTDPKDVKVTMDKNGYALYFSRSTIPYDRDGDENHNVYKHLGVYAYTKRFLEIFRNLPEGELERIEKLEQLRVLENGYRVKVVKTRHDSPEVDVPEDISRIREKIARASI